MSSFIHCWRSRVGETRYINSTVTVTTVLVVVGLDDLSGTVAIVLFVYCYLHGNASWVIINSDPVYRIIMTGSTPIKNQRQARIVVVMKNNKKTTTTKTKTDKKTESTNLRVASKGTKRTLHNSETVPSTSGGLPTFSLKRKIDYDVGRQGPSSSYTKDDDDDERFTTEYETDTLLAELPSDTHMAIQSLLQESRGLFIPLVDGNGSYVQVLLEYQITQRFSENCRNVSETISELHDLWRTNQLCRLDCGSSWDNEFSSRRLAYLWTNDYILAVRHAQQHHHSLLHVSTTSRPSWNNQEKQPARLDGVITSNDMVIDWFLHHLSCWSGMSTISRLDFEREWPVPCPTPTTTTSTTLTLDQAILFLLDIHVLKRDDSNGPITAMVNHHGGEKDEERYQLWLPNWGIVLKAWRKSRRQVLMTLARTPRNELSEKNLLSKQYGNNNNNNNNTISMSFLLHDLVQDDKIQIIERPFGKFVKSLVGGGPKQG